MKKLLTLLIFLAATSLISQTKMINDEVMSYSNPEVKENCSAEIKFDPQIHENSDFASMNLYPAFICLSKILWMMVTFYQIMLIISPGAVYPITKVASGLITDTGELIFALLIFALWTDL